MKVTDRLRLALPEPLRLTTGASFTAVTLCESATVEELNAVLPPRVPASTVVPVLTLALESISDTVICGAAPLKFAASFASRRSRTSAKESMGVVPVGIRSRQR